MINTKIKIPETPNLTAEQILSFLIENGTVNMDGVQEEMNRNRRYEILSKHEHEIYFSDDGRWKTYVPCPETKRGTKLRAKKRLSDLYDDIIERYIELENKNHSKKATLESLFEDWLVYKSKHVQETTIMRNRQDWVRYYAEEPIIHKPIAEITKLELDEFVHDMIRKHNMDRHMYTNFSSILRQELNYAVDLGIIDSNELLKVRVNRRETLRPDDDVDDLTQVFTKEEIAQIKELAWEEFKNETYRVNQLVPLAVIFVILTGLRRGELVAVRYEDIINGRIYVRRFYRHHTKQIIEGTKGAFGPRDILLIPEAFEILAAAQQRQRVKGVSDSGYIFSMNDQPLSYSAIGKAFKKYCDKLGIRPRSPHKGRKTHISAVLDAGLGLNTARKQAGHLHEETLLGSYYFDRSNDEKKIEIMTRALSE